MRNLLHTITVMLLAIFVILYAQNNSKEYVYSHWKIFQEDINKYCPVTKPDDIIIVYRLKDDSFIGKIKETLFGHQTVQTINLKSVHDLFYNQDTILIYKP